MRIRVEAGTALQRLLGPLAIEAARATGVITRQRVFTPLSLARPFVLGFLKRPAARDEHLARVAAQSGAPSPPRPSTGDTRPNGFGSSKPCSAGPPG